LFELIITKVWNLC